jgi:hypothetical protein
VSQDTFGRLRYPEASRALTSQSRSMRDSASLASASIAFSLKSAIAIIFPTDRRPTYGHFRNPFAARAHAVAQLTLPDCATRIEAARGFRPAFAPALVCAFSSMGQETRLVRDHAKITSQPPAWRRLSVCRVPTPRDALWSTSGRRPESRDAAGTSAGATYPTQPM